jgi:hypothetical protein
MREYVEAGGLLSYGPIIRYNFERAAGACRHAAARRQSRRFTD